MKVERFAGEDMAMQQMAELMAKNKADMQARQAEAMQQVYAQRARDVRATGVKNPEMFL